MRRALATLACLTAAALPPSAQNDKQAVTDDANLRLAWDLMPAELRREALEWFALEAQGLKTLQGALIEHALQTAGRDASDWPATGERPFFDPAVHAPGQPIPRRRLAPEAEAARALAERCARVRPPRRLQSAWEYDWATGDLRRRARADPLEIGFWNAALGYLPNADLAEALCLRALDTGEVRAALAGFGHAYTDREGNVFPLSLYEAWSSGLEIEMPDVDALGLAHDVLGERQRWKAPIPAPEQAPLYALIRRRFSEARRYRGLREALAACWLAAEPVLWDGFGPMAPELHALWEERSSTPAELALELPREASQYQGFLAEWGERCQRETLLRQSGLRRQAQLASEAAKVRGTFVWVLRELGAFDARPAEPEPEASAPGETGLQPAEIAEPDPAALERALRAFSRLKPRERGQLEDALRAKVAASPAPQAALVRALVADVDPAQLPPALRAGPHDGRAYGGPVRKRVARGTPRWEALYAAVAPPEGWREPSYVYDFGARAVQRRAPGKGEEARLFEAALAGEAPETDLAEALLLARLDARSKLVREAAFFFRDYADLSAQAYEGISLFDVWSHAIPIDVPDVDVFAYADLVWQERDLPAALSGRDQGTWYPRMAASLHALRRHVLPARALAAVWFRARPPLGQGYAESIDTLHALIALEHADVALVAERLQRLEPEVVERTLAEIEARGTAAWDAGNARRDALAAGETHVRAAALEVLRAADLLE